MSYQIKRRSMPDNIETGQIDLLPTYTNENKNQILDALIQNALDSLPGNSVFEIRESLDHSRVSWNFGPPEPYCRTIEALTIDGPKLIKNPDGTPYMHKFPAMDQTPLFKKKIGHGESILCGLVPGREFPVYFLVARLST